MSENFEQLEQMKDDMSFREIFSREVMKTGSSGSQSSGSQVPVHGSQMLVPKSKSEATPPWLKRKVPREPAGPPPKHLKEAYAEPLLSLKDAE